MYSFCRHHYSTAIPISSKGGSWFNYENTLSAGIYSNFEEHKDEIRKIAGVEGVTASQEFIGNGYNISIQDVQLGHNDDFHMVSTLHVI